MLKSTKLLTSLLALTAMLFVCVQVGAQEKAEEAQAEVENTEALATDEDAASTENDAEAGEDKAGDAAVHEPGESHEPGEHDAGHVDHVDLDPTHGNVSDATFKVVPSPFPVRNFIQDFRTDMAFFSAIVFLLLLAGLTAVAWKPIMEGLEKRERGIADNISRAEKAAAEATAKLAEYEAKLAGAAEESQRILAEARKDAEATGQKLIASAQEEAAVQRDRAIADIEAAKRVALSELASQSTEVAMSLAQRVVGREVKAADHQGLIQDMLSKVPSEN